MYQPTKSTYKKEEEFKIAELQITLLLLGYIYGATAYNYLLAFNLI